MHFKNIIGHDSQKNLLRRAVAEGRVSHSYIFSGLDGLGKRLVALGFAKILNCLKPQSQRSTNSDTGACDCNSCRKIDKGIHPDVFVIEYKGLRDIKVDQIREDVEERLYFKPFEGRCKVAIVDEADRMSNSAQNAFLKTLEEPPNESVIILLTSSPQSLLPTIRSRCQPLRFECIPIELIVEELKTRRGLSGEESDLIALLSEGSLGRALTLDRNILSDRNELIRRLSKVETDFASSVLGVVESILKGSSSDEGEQLRIYLEFILLWLRDLINVKVGLDEDSLINKDLVAVSREYARRSSLERIVEKLSFVEQVSNAILRLNANKQLALENLVLKIADEY
jgi:DNA polymerase-3 subunit delta'